MMLEYEERKMAINEERIAEKGANIIINVMFIRHGERVGPKLIDYGREQTKKNAMESGIGGKDYNIIKAGGSNFQPVNEAEINKEKVEVGRALETADIYAKGIPEGV